MEVTTEQALIEMIRQMNIAQDALEQHHKDLMGLVERWRDREAEFWKRKDDYSFGLHQAYGNAADDLEEIINPRD